MKKQELNNLTKKVALLKESVETLTYNYENKIPNQEINLDCDTDNVNADLQYFVTDVGLLPNRGTLKEFQDFFNNAEQSMKENNIDSKNIIFDFGDYGTNSGIKAIIFGDETVNKSVYIKEIKNIHNKLNEYKNELNNTIDNYTQMHNEYKSISSDTAIDKAHQKLISPYAEVVSSIDEVLVITSQKIDIYSDKKKKKTL